VALGSTGGGSSVALHGSGGRRPEFANLYGLSACARLPPRCQAKVIPYIFRIMTDRRRVPLILEGVMRCRLRVGFRGSRPPA
jgi:hypothetical protein